MEIPKIGLGTWKLQGTHGQNSIETALEIGYRHLDTAIWYHNHDIVGNALKSSGVDREEIFLVTKIPPPLTRDNILRKGENLLRELQVAYVDLLLVHWPDNNPVTEVLESFRKLKEQGVTRRIGVSNFDIVQMEAAVDAGFEIYNHQIELFPGNFDSEMVNFCKQHNITVTAYSPLKEGGLANNQKLAELSDKLMITPAQLILAWLIAKGTIVIPKASSREHLQENFDAATINLPPDVVKQMDEFSDAQ
jgi:diketogulonate reductase-like aldo/keto reductase